ncbi:hypothetical protein VITU102760_24785 [Vibrio tubiashii]|uniref:Uncharacterized protein n=1 Tax=Vibrio tubiashii ATCC 19109 TaxID=1051646 RepID=F9T6T5_9VIBR|nr:hypothetical protein [Vibrio tubiashii]AIW17499.1 hypothetical protein IX91_25925 [Vibrio tubiashii ATCC 19109]EGU54490.1 hypothetical protein VITU9109_02912 [Vibrio tubiashii ATCC 19109]EIF05987.1 hypothetical protein VT1337_00570 [Vibrio tubiashii NCIMB 1337 = ATCC 19106]
MKIPISKSDERKVLSKSDSFFLAKDDYIARFERRGKQVVYSAKCEVVCLGEYFIDKHSPNEHWVLIYQLSTEIFYSAVIRNGLIIIETTGSKETVFNSNEYDINLAKTLVTNFNHSQEEIEVINVGQVDLTSIPNQYVTSNDEAKKKYGRKALLQGLTVATILVVSLIVFFGVKGDSKQSVQYVDIYSSYKADIDGQIDAHHALQQAAYLYALSMTLPEGLEIQEITKVGNDLVMMFKSNDFRISSIQQWIEDNPEIKPYYVNKQFIVSLSGSSKKWRKNILPTSGFPDYLHDQALELGASNVVLSDIVDNGAYQQQSISGSFDRHEIGVVSHFSELLEDTPSFLTSLRITPSDGKSSLVGVQFGISIKGKNNGN